MTTYTCDRKGSTQADAGGSDSDKHFQSDRTRDGKKPLHGIKSMCEELDIQYTDTTEVAVVKVVFSTLGCGNYY